MVDSLNTVGELLYHGALCGPPLEANLSSASSIKNMINDMFGQRKTDFVTQ